MIDAYNGIFDEKLKRIKNRLKDQLSNTKSKRDRQAIKRLIKEAKEIRDVLKKSKKTELVCPHCGGVIMQGEKHE